MADFLWKSAIFMSIYSLSKLLTLLGVTKHEDLSSDEKEMYEKYKAILVGREITVDQIKEFCKSQINVIHSKCDGVTLLSPVQQASLHIYINILRMIDAPELERENLERYLDQLTNNIKTTQHE